MKPTTSLNNGQLVVRQNSYRDIQITTVMGQPVGAIDLLNTRGSDAALLPFLGDPSRQDLREIAQNLEGSEIVLKPEIAKQLGHPKVTIKFWQHVKA